MLRTGRKIFYFFVKLTNYLKHFLFNTMATIHIHLDVKNAQQVVNSQKGKWIGLAAGLFMNKQKLKQKVEQAICQEIIKALEANIPHSLAEQGVRADISFTVDLGGPRPQLPDLKG